MLDIDKCFEGMKLDGKTFTKGINESDDLSGKINTSPAQQFKFSHFELFFPHLHE